MQHQSHDEVNVSSHMSMWCSQQEETYSACHERFWKKVRASSNGLICLRFPVNLDYSPERQHMAEKLRQLQRHSQPL
ncbi:hypothetical protein HBI56_235470 [Parastagonospora nodorum]|nr:hypothetical protein HBH53_243100 [Parastagonospora nodorum]KAH3959025.1 hypothetical protein HBH51_203950 [Parastagonospora nodorum]KAH3963595.1 hypothetical protein HBH52_218270 [Parastagonospora nodorum]KAH4010937.1 hypothetical protein HBI09_229280 [Parastagonospora nodorum]KAH4059152.1 hypothetical protein HBH50_228790 [Parastagonospora nodorum]